MKEQREIEKTKLKEAELKTLRNLEEQAKLSAQRLNSLNSDEVTEDRLDYTDTNKKLCSTK